jgi:hypothetical protein
MNFKNTILPVLASGIWISISEFVRNEFILKSFWLEHYQSMGLQFPGEPINGAIWGLWSMVYAIVIFILSKRFNLLESFGLSWIIGFVMMWLVIGNLGVLPFGLLFIAIPLSLLESYLACFNVKKLA